MSVAETEASILKIVSLKDPVDAMHRLRLLAPIETLVYRRDGDSADQSEGRPVVLVPKASSSLVDVINFLRSGDASAFDDRAKKIVRLGATVQLIQLLAALHTRKVVHGKLEPKAFCSSVMAFSTSPTSAEHVATGRGSRHPVRVGTVHLRFWSTPRHRTRIPGTGILSELSFSSYGAEGCHSIWGHPESILQRNSRSHTR
ncbi:cAMP-dependent protein kinase [Toxoplasma gondii]|uniref:cAMP-dependent protein kinase n=1 Tax=Toxoplasma gondii TaxID=5811 RepID=A0A7J6KFW9_TOXGO|nr:cAMP-dependent protein kinase [Toxoplasma gondii]